ncbi:MAG: hypothetical protein AAF502_24135 [Bacteroidota bacterium]
MRFFLFILFLVVFQFYSFGQTPVSFQQFNNDINAIIASAKKMVEAQNGYVDIAGEPYKNEIGTLEFYTKDLNLPAYCSSATNLERAWINVAIQIEDSGEMATKKNITDAIQNVIGPYLESIGYSFDESLSCYIIEQGGQERWTKVEVHGDIDIELTITTQQIDLDYSDPELLTLYQVGQEAIAEASENAEPIRIDCSADIAIKNKTTIVKAVLEALDADSNLESVKGDALEIEKFDCNFSLPECIGCEVSKVKHTWNQLITLNFNNSGEVNNTYEKLLRNLDSKLRKLKFEKDAKSINDNQLTWTKLSDDSFMQKGDYKIKVATITDSVKLNLYHFEEFSKLVIIVERGKTSLF